MNTRIRPSWQDLWTLFEATDDLAAYDRLDEIEVELLADGTNRRLKIRADHREFLNYWQAIADEYVNRYGDPTGQETS